MATKRMERSTAQVVFVGNQKGGVGKTTNCVHMAAALGAAGRKCLVWDLDANQGATLHLGINGDRYLGAYEVLSGREAARDVIISPRDAGVSLPQGVDLLPAGSGLERVGRLRGDVLAGAIDQLKDQYDYIFLDTAPNLTTPTRAAYQAASWFVFSVMPDPFAVVGLKTSLEHLRAAIAGGNRRARLLGVLFARVQSSRSPKSWFNERARLDRMLIEYAQKYLKDRRGGALSFSTTIGSTVEIPRCQMQGRTLFQTKPRHRVTGQYRNLGRELEEKIRIYTTRN
ncbi:MAG: chromosome partitioning protein [Candidatus Latescibacterota bacterium]